MEFARDVNGASALHSKDDCRESKKIYLPTPYSAGSLVYTVDEIGLLDGLLQKPAEATQLEKLPAVGDVIAGHTMFEKQRLRCDGAS